HEDRGGDPRNEPRPADVDAVGLGGGVGSRHRAAPVDNGKAWGTPERLLRERHGRRATQQLQQQQQPATRHRSTARRLVSMGSRRANTSDSLPNDTRVKPTVGSAPSAGRQQKARRLRGSAGGPRRRRSASSAATTPKSAAPERGWNRGRPRRGPRYRGRRTLR